MLPRARQTYENKQPALPPRTRGPNPTLAKQLFPSSSPRPAPGGSIENFLGTPRKSQGSTTFTKSATFAASSLTQRSTNSSRLASSDPNHAATTSSVRPIASLYGNTGSFQDAEEVVDLTNDSQPAPGRLPAGVYIEDGDFDDDDELDLNYEEPSALPPLPRDFAADGNSNNSNKFVELPPPTNTSALSWSQSSPSHYQPPQQRPVAQHDASKRELVDGASSPLPVAKKRAMPRDWRTRPQDIEEDAGPQETSFTTPATKPKLWDTTASAVKAQRKELKSKQKESSREPTQAFPEEAKEMVKSHSAKSAVISLSNEQRHVKSLVIEKGQSVFFTGPAGTGKSVLMRSIIHELKQKHARDSERVAVTASTGLAACNIGGMTLHSFSGIGLGKEDAQTLVKKIRRNPKAKSRWLRTKVLIIDEISMVDGELFDKLSQIGRVIRNNGRPWGGIQLVITGDFFQLPPVPDGSKQRDVKFAFEAATWNTSIDHTIGLTEVFRQRDPVFAQMLNEMRLGRISDQTIRNFRSLDRPLHFDDGLEVTELFPTRNEVESSNERRLRALSGKTYRYVAVDQGEPAVREKLLQNMMAPKSLDLKTGAQVMLIKNMDETLVNGSLGTVTGFMSESTFELMGGVDDSAAGAEGEVDAKVKRRIQAFGRELDGKNSSGDTTEYPLVKFHAVDGTERVLLCVPEDWKVELPTGEVQASRKQLPLILAWALSIHKAQGQTLERVKVDLGRVFEKGQAYVALSRATTQQGLQVLRFHKDKVMAHPRVVNFYNKLYSAESAVKKKTQTAAMASLFSKQVSGSDTLARHGKEAADPRKDGRALSASG